MRRARVGAAVALLLGVLVPRTAAADWPAWAERWLFNPVERTERAVRDFAAGEAGTALPIRISVIKCHLLSAVSLIWAL